MQLECELTDFIGKAPDQALALDTDIEPHVAQAGLLPQHMGMRQWLLQRPAIFDVDGQRVSLTRQSIEYDRHLETQFVALLQRLGRPAHMSKDIVTYCRKNNIDMRVSSLTHHMTLHAMYAYTFCIINSTVALNLPAATILQKTYTHALSPS